MLSLHAHVEHLYTVIAREHGIEFSAEVLSVFGGQRADITVYQDSKPSAIIELKKFDDYKSPAGIVADRDKMAKLSRLCRVDAYLGIFVTDVSAATCVERIQLLQATLSLDFSVVGPPQKSSDGRWQWCFASAYIPYVSTATVGGVNS